MCTIPKQKGRRFITIPLFSGIPEPQGIAPKFGDIFFRILIQGCFWFRLNVVHFLSLTIYVSLTWSKCRTLSTEQYLDYSSHPLWFKKTWTYIPQDNRKLNLVTYYLNVMTLFLWDLLLNPTQTKAKETHFDCNGYRHNEIRLTESCSIFFI